MSKIGEPDLKGHKTNFKHASWHGADLSNVDNVSATAMPGEQELKSEIDHEKAPGLLKKLLDAVLHPKHDKDISR